MISIHVAKKPEDRRPGYVYDEDGIGVPIVICKPVLHEDPEGRQVLCCSDGQVRVLTLWERAQLNLGLTTLWLLDLKYRRRAR